MNRLHASVAALDAICTASGGYGAKLVADDAAPDVKRDHVIRILELLSEERMSTVVLTEKLDAIHALVASSASYVPQDLAAELMLRLGELGFGQQEPRRGNTLWGMVLDAADEIEQRRAEDEARSKRADDRVAVPCKNGNGFVRKSGGSSNDP